MLPIIVSASWCHRLCSHRQRVMWHCAVLSGHGTGVVVSPHACFSSSICHLHPSTLKLPFKLLKEVQVVCIRVFVHCREVNTFVLAGRDGTVSIRDHTVKKQLWQYPKYTLGVQDLVFNVDGLGLAVGVRDVPTIRLINELTQSRARQAMSVSGDSAQLYNLIASWVCFSHSDCLAVGQRIAS